MSENQGPPGNFPPPPPPPPPPGGNYPPPPPPPPPGGNPPPPPGGYPPPPPPPQDPYGYAQPYQPNPYPINVSFEYPQQSSRLLNGLSIPFYLARYIMIIPAAFCLYFVGIAAFVVAWIAFIAILFTGRYPEGMFRFCSGYVRWSTRVSSYMLGLTDKYPPFRLQD